MKRGLLVGLTSVLACATAATVFGTRSDTDEILFPHSRHIAAKIECISCHETIFDAKSLAGGGFLPNEDKCMECHKQKKADGQCTMCHSDVATAAPWPTRDVGLNFDHAAHIERTKEDCSKCHSRLPEPRVSGPVSDGHAACMQCHEHATHYEDGKCSTCHVYPLRPSERRWEAPAALAAADGGVAAAGGAAGAADGGAWAPSPHQGDFLRHHGMIAKSAGQSCNNCHDQDQSVDAGQPTNALRNDARASSFCLDCHSRTAMVPIEARFSDRPDRQFIHRNDFLGRHMVEARADPASCQRCHTVSSCETCHKNEHVSAGSINAKSPHPSSWVLPGSGGAFHGDEARRNISSCAACHDQGDQSNCVSCHKVGGVGGDPHPAGFRTRHTLPEAKSDGRCAACHR